MCITLCITWTYLYGTSIWGTLSVIAIFNNKRNIMIKSFRMHFTYGRPLRISYLHSQPGGNWLLSFCSAIFPRCVVLIITTNISRRLFFFFESAINSLLFIQSRYSVVQRRNSKIKQNRTIRNLHEPVLNRFLGSTLFKSNFYEYMLYLCPFLLMHINLQAGSTIVLSLNCDWSIP